MRFARAPVLCLPAIFALTFSAPRAWALLYLPENTLESLLIRADVVAIGTVTDATPNANRAELSVSESFKGNAAATLTVTGMMLQVDTDVRKPRFAKGDRIVVFLGPQNAATFARPIMHSQTLATDAEVRTMSGCIKEIQPVAQALTDLGNIKKEIDEKALRPILTQLLASKNSYTQILLGRLLSTRLTERVNPAGWEDLILPALASKRRELALGGIAWAAKFNKLPPAVKAALEKAAADSESEDVKKKAAAKLKELH